MWRALEQGAGVDFQRVALDHLEAIGIDLAQLGERGEAAAVALDRGDARAGGE